MTTTSIREVLQDQIHKTGTFTRRVLFWYRHAAPGIETDAPSVRGKVG